MSLFRYLIQEIFFNIWKVLEQTIPKLFICISKLGETVITDIYFSVSVSVWHSFQRIFVKHMKSNGANYTKIVHCYSIKGKQNIHKTFVVKIGVLWSPDHIYNHEIVFLYNSNSITNSKLPHFSIAVTYSQCLQIH